jgi:DNA-binding transcriptional MerR regulator
MTKSRYHAVVLARSSQELTLDRLADAAQVHPEFIKTMVSYGLVEPIREAESEMTFRASAVLRVQKITRIREDLGVNLAGVEIILRLTEELEEARKELERLLAASREG